MDQFFDTSGNFNWESLPNTLLQAWQSKRQADIQDQLIELNIARAQAGKSPITLSQIGGAMSIAPQAGVTVGVSDSTKSLLINGTLIAGALYLASKLFR